MLLAPNDGWIATSFRSLPDFALTRASTLAEARQALIANPGATFFSGGTDLVARFNEGFAPQHAIDVSRVEELQTIVERDNHLVIGAGVSHYAGSRHPLVREKLPGFASAWARIANVRIRMSATLGGNVMARRTRYEGAILLSALAASLQLFTSEGERSLPVEAIWRDDFPPSALLTEIRIPLRPGLAFDYERSMRPVMTQALAMDGAGNGRLVTATEFTTPRILHFNSETPPHFAPYAVSDPVASDAYLNQVAGVFLQRQLQRLKTA